MGHLFGTDGVRGLANADLTPEFALSLSQAAARVLPVRSIAPASGRPTAPASGRPTAPASGRPTAPASGRPTAPASGRPTAIVGRDTRASGEMLEAAVCAGLAAAGVDALRVGVVPTPAVAYLTDFYDAAFGVMISASHNPMPDNGIKFFAAGGHKLADAAEDAIESALDTVFDRPIGAGVGRVRDAQDGLDAYLTHLSAAVDVELKSVTVVVDCAHGAAHAAAPRAYRAAGATVIAISADPDGENINKDCGSTHLDRVQAAVLEYGADLGLAHDGDADRCLAVDAAGQVVDGDAIMAVLASAMKDAGRLKDNTIVATVMSNLGLHLAMTDAGITVRTTAVGDRYVLEELRAGGFSLGGEQSGHLVIPSHGTTGDGILTGLMLMGRMAETGRSLADLASIMSALPQVLLNVRVADKNVVAQADSVKQAVTDGEAELGATGRVLLRPSGTEQLVRVMVEAATTEQAHSVAAKIAAAVESV